MLHENKKTHTNTIVMLAIAGALLLVALSPAIVKASTIWTEETFAKYNALKDIGMDKYVAYSLIENCKATATNPVNCIKLGASILGAESSLGHKCHNNNCVGMNDGGVAYKSKQEGIKAWVAKYNKWWWRQTSPTAFYRADGIPPVTHYCMGANRDGVCVNGYKNAWRTFNSLNF